MTTARRYVNPWTVATIIVIALGLTVLAVALPPLRQAKLIRQIEAGGGKVHLEVNGPAWIADLIEKYKLERWLGTPFVVWIEPGRTDAQLGQVLRWRGVVHLHITGGSLTQAHLRGIATMNKLEALGLRELSIETGGLQPLVTLSSMRGLYLLDVAGLTDNDVTHIAAMTNLTTLAMSGAPQISGATLDQLPTSLRGLFLTNLTGLTDDAVALLGAMLELTSLHLSGAHLVTGETLDRLPVGLRSLVLDGTGITDEHLARLKHLEQLKYLTLHDTSITDAGLVHLHHLKALRDLEIGNAKVTVEGVVELERQMPNLRPGIARDWD